MIIRTKKSSFRTEKITFRRDGRPSGAKRERQIRELRKTLLPQAETPHATLFTLGGEKKGGKKKKKDTMVMSQVTGQTSVSLELP